MPRKYQVWIEGHSCTEERQGATFLGVFEGATFADACRAWAKTASKPDLFDDVRLTYWACKLFDNEADARGILP